MANKPYKRPNIDELSAIDAIKESWLIMTDNIKMLFMTLILPLLVAAPLFVVIAAVVILGLIDEPEQLNSTTGLGSQEIAVVVFLGLLAAAMLLVLSMFYVGATKGVLEHLKTGKKYTLKQAWNAGKTYIMPSIVVGLITGVIVVVGMFALIIPGLIAAFLLMLVAPAVVDDYTKLAALKRSKDLVMRNVTLVLLVFVAVVGLSIVLSLVPLIGFIAQLLFELLFVCLTVYLYWVLAGDEKARSA